MRLTDFPDAVKKMDKKQIRELIRLLKKERNETLAASDTERDKIFAKSEAMKDKSKAKDYKDEEFKKITAKYRDKISDLRSKITIAQRYD
jgi:CII-binding regulator of phage lambda lysogenization HflD